MTIIAPMTDDALKTANALYPLVGTLAGAAGGALAAPHVSALGDFIGQHHHGLATGFEGGSAPAGFVAQTPENLPADDPKTPRVNEHQLASDAAYAKQLEDFKAQNPSTRLTHAPLTSDEMLHLQRMYGAGIGGAAGLGAGLLAAPREEERPMVRTAAVEGIKAAVHPALAALLGAGVGAASGGALGHFAPGMDQALQENFPTESNVDLGHLAGPQVDPGVDPTMLQKLLGQGAGLINQGSDLTEQGTNWALHEGAPRALDHIQTATQATGDAINRYVPGAQELSNVVGGPATLGGAAIGAGAGGLAGLSYGLATRGQDDEEQNPSAAPKMAFRLNVDGDVEGSAIDVLTAKIAALGTTLGTLGGIAGGAMLGNYLTPAMHWVMMPGGDAAMGHVGHEQVVGPALEATNQHADPADRSDAAAELQKNMAKLQNPDYLEGLSAGAAGQRGVQWEGLSNLGRIGGAGIGGITGYQVGRGLDEALGLERKERPLVISPMAQRA